MCGVELNPWERESVKFLSRTYLNARHEYSDKDAKRPYLTEASLEIVKHEDAQRMRAMILNKVKAR